MEEREKIARSFALLAVICEDEMKNTILQIMGRPNEEIGQILHEKLASLRRAHDALLMMFRHYMEI